MPQRRASPRASSAETVLDHALDVGAFTATEAMESTGLTRSTVLAACEDLVARGWLTELDDARTAGEYRIGRPARRYELDPTAGCVVGVDAGQHRVAAFVADLRGAVLARAETDLGTRGLDVGFRLDAVATTVTAALAAAGTDADRVLVTTVGVPAPVDARGVSPDDGGFWVSMNPGFGAVAPGARVVVENDANLAAIAERPSAPEASFAALLAGERFGAGLVVDGVLLRGARGGAGELRALGLVVGVGSSDGLGAAARTAVTAAVDAGRVDPDSPLGRAVAREGLDAAAVFRAADDGDPVALEVVDQLGDLLARVCVLLASLLDIDRVVVAGAIAGHAGAVIDHASAVLGSGRFDPVPEIVASTLGADVVVTGAVALALDTVRADPLSFDLRTAPAATAAVG